MNKPKPNISEVEETSGTFRIKVDNIITFDEPTCNGRIYRKECMPDILQQMNEREIFLYKEPFSEDIHSLPLGILDKDSIKETDYKISCDFVISDETVKDFLRTDSSCIHVYPSYMGYLDHVYNDPDITAFVLEPRLMSFSIEVIS